MNCIAILILFSSYLQSKVKIKVKIKNLVIQLNELTKGGGSNLICEVFSVFKTLRQMVI